MLLIVQNLFTQHNANKIFKSTQLVTKVERYFTYKNQIVKQNKNFEPPYIQRFAGYSSKAVSAADNILKIVMVKNVATRVSSNPLS